MNDPRTLEEALSRKYNVWSGNPEGTKYVEGRCAQKVLDVGKGWIYPQCSRQNGYGPGELYCTQHAKYFRELTLREQKGGSCRS